ncbi:MAG TPA: hypothetical protein VHI99_20550 [Vicinamibacterales bacterium]|jgi:hypothetical protein|nr:hypothetical protein [Vicinamibacterales bacterium]
MENRKDSRPPTELVLALWLRRLGAQGISLLRPSRHADPRLVAVAAPELTHAVLHAEELEMQ